MKYNFEKIKVWDKSHKLVLDIYKITKNFPLTEKYGMCTQLRRSAASIATNIVEGSIKQSPRDFLRYIDIANGSLEETKYHSLLSKDLEYINELTYARLFEQTNEIGKML